ncbi:hypothetical protein [Candidatus Halocynthiibacter alkanivorans]|uniref:DUF6854 domain-containing protein n=1 Tax=Candidatus Halocynthiibacter alkanivorans TaxID=2267619 RepID=UPI00109D20BC|nr:hypothetical protein [Candidatus Halocynthiibacter alkanivorans]
MVYETPDLSQYAPGLRRFLRRLLGVGYPSMDAIEKTYDALRSSKDYKAMVGDIELDWRNIVKFVG